MKVKKKNTGIYWNLTQKKELHIYIYIISKLNVRNDKKLQKKTEKGLQVY